MATTPSTTRGIKNVSGVSCHISCALQIILHAIRELSQALKKATNRHEKSFHSTRILAQLADLVNQLHTLSPSLIDEVPPVDPSNLYKSLENFSSSSSSKSKTRLSLDQHEVGDASTAISLLLRIIAQQSQDWAMLVDLCTVGSTRYSITGIQKTLNGSTITRTKPGKSKRMPCPFPLEISMMVDDDDSSSFPSLQESLYNALEPKTVIGYNWNGSNPSSYEERIIIEESQSNGKYDKSDKDDDDDDASHNNNNNNKWQTTKTLHIDSWPRYCFFHLERFTYDSKGRKRLINPNIDIPLTLHHPHISSLESSKSLSSSPTSKAEDEAEEATKVLHLLGGILHVTRKEEAADEEEEDGHYVTLLRNLKNKRDCHAVESSWILVDDDTCKVIEDDQTALDLLKGGGGGGSNDYNDGNFYCATLVVYGEEEGKEEEEDASVDRTTSSTSVLLRKIVKKLEQEGPEDLIDRRLKVKWAKNKFYEGVVKSYDPSSQKHNVLYDDGDQKDTRKAYDAAILAAIESGCTNHAALGSEIAGEYFYQKRNAQGLASDYFSQASDFYKEWGALAKVDDLAAKYGNLIKHSHSSEKLLQSSEFILAKQGKDLDMLSSLAPCAELPC